MNTTGVKHLLPILCWASYPVVFLFFRNREFCPVDQVWRPLAVVIAASILVWLVLSASLRSWAKGTIATCVGAALFFAYGHLATALLPYEFELAGAVVGPNKVLVAAYVPILIAGWWTLARSRRSLDLHLRGLTVAGALLCIMSLLPAFPTDADPALNHSVGHVDVPLLAASPEEGRPPIYLIVLDAYAGERVLHNMYGFDNSQFLNGLRGRGFFVAENSHSNYPQSILSIASMLNFSYLDDLLLEIDESSRSRRPLSQLIQDNLLFRTLGKAGYRTITFDASGWDAVNISASDHFVETPGMGLSPLENELVNTSLAGLLARLLPEKHGNARANFHRYRIEYAFDNLEQLADEPGPFLAYAHIGCPHQPFVFDAGGAAVAQSSERFATWFAGEQVADPDAYRRGYVEQLQYMNLRIEKLIDKLMAPGRERPIVILLSDHGPAMELHIRSVDRTNVDERFSNLMAIYFPDADYQALYSSITPVNAIRCMLNEQFGATLELLPDKQFYAAWDQPYRLVPVLPGR